MYGCKLDEERLNNERIADVLRSNSEYEKVETLISTKINIMKTSNIPMWLLRICSHPIFIYCTFKQNGFFNGLRSLFMSTYINTHFWMIRNCKWYRNILHKKYAKCGEEGEMLFDLIVNYWDINVKDFLNKYTKFK